MPSVRGRRRKRIWRRFTAFAPSLYRLYVSRWGRMHADWLRITITHHAWHGDTLPYEDPGPTCFSLRTRWLERVVSPWQRQS